MSPESERQVPGQLFGRRVEEARKSRGWTQEQLAARLRELGVRSSRSTIAKLEGRGSRATLAKIEDLFALAAALGVPPVHLLVPLDDEAPVSLAPNVTVPAPAARAWIRGALVLPMLANVDYTQIPLSELRANVYRELTRDMDRLTLAMVGEALTATANRIAEEIRNPKEEQ